MRRAALGVLAALVASGLGCGEARRTPVPAASIAPPPNAPTAPQPTVGAPPSPTSPPSPPTSVVAPRPASNASDLGTTEVAEHGCATLGDPRPIASTPGAIAAVGLPVGHAIAATVSDATSTSVVVIASDETGRAARVVARIPVGAPVALGQLVPPGLARIGATRIAVATIDASRRLAYREVDLGTGAVSSSAILAESGADGRFPPAIAVIGDRRLVAYTKLGNPQRVEAITVSDVGAMLRRQDVTPPSAGAVSPTFVPDVAPPTLVLVDPRDALSLAHAVAFDATGAKAGGESLQPIIGLANPARIAAVRGRDDVVLVYLAYGDPGGVGSYSLGAHASSLTPRPLIPPATGVRPWVDALGAPFGAITTGLAPNAANPAIRDVVVRLLDSAGPGPELRIVSSAESAFFPTPSRDDAGHLAIFHATTGGIAQTRIACLGR